MNLLTRTSNHSNAAASNVAFTYTASGQRATMSDASGVTTYGYDARDQLVSKATPQGTLAYTHDAAGNVASMTSSNAEGVAVVYRHDDLNRLEEVEEAAGEVTGYEYDEVGNLARVTTANGVTHAYGYNALNWLAGMTVGNVTSTLATHAYTSARTGHRSSAVEAFASTGGAAPLNRTARYTYDALYRLTGETIIASAGPAGQAGYTHDPVGNRLSRGSTLAGLGSQSFAYDANDRLQGESSDANGNTLSGGVSVPPAGAAHPAEPLPTAATSDSYDAENRLIARSAPLPVEIVYDGDGHKVRETSNGQVISYLVDDRNPTGYAQVVEELQNGAVVRTYTYGHDLLLQDQRDGTGLWNATWYGYDGHGNVRLLTDGAGNVTDRYDYDAFGQLLHAEGTTFNRYRYCGEQYDSALGLYYLRARLMNPLTGRFWTMDSYEGDSEDSASLHKYAYAEIDPVNGIDPSGYSVEKAHLGSEAHLLFTAFMITRSGSYKYYNSSLGTICPDLRGKAGGRLRPDAVVPYSYDPSLTGRFFELKPDSHRTDPSRASQANAQLARYNTYLQPRGWYPGNAGTLVVGVIDIGSVTSKSGQRYRVVLNSSSSPYSSGPAKGAIVYYNLIPQNPEKRDPILEVEREYATSRAALAVAKVSPTLIAGTAAAGLGYMAAVLSRQMVVSYGRL